MLKPPVREVCLDIVEDLWRNRESKSANTISLHSSNTQHLDKDVQTASKKILQRFRPDVLKVIAPDV